MPIFLGNTEISAVYHGSSQIAEIYRGNTKLWPTSGGGGLSANQLKFIYTSTAANESFPLLPGVNEGTYNAVVDWGDGSSSEITAFDDADGTHVYAAADAYEVLVTGQLGTILQNTTAAAKVTNFEAGPNCTVITGAFYQMLQGCASSTGFPVFDTSGFASSSVNASACFKNSDFTGACVGTGWAFAQTCLELFRNSNITGFDSPDGLNSSGGYSRMFQGCSSLENIAANLFDTISSAPNFAFYLFASNTSSLTAQSVENVLTSIAYAVNNNGLVAPEVFPNIDIDYDVNTGSLSSATTTAIAVCKSAGFDVVINGVSQ
jgi:hypothetical protein